MSWSYIVIRQRNKKVPTYFNEKDITCKTQNFYVLLVFLLITIALMIAVSMYCYLIKYQTGYLLSFK